MAMTIRAILASKGGDVVSVSSGDLVSDALALLAERRIGAVPVIDDGHVVGIFSERDIIYSLAKSGATALDARIGDVMTAPAMTVDPETPVMSGLSLMTKRRIRHLPVVQDGAVIGFISIGDLVKFRIDRIEAEAAAMRDYIAS
jgi:CBS domain-containing protein